MRRTLHKRRDQRYLIALKELKSTFDTCGGEMLFDELFFSGKKLSKSEKLIHTKARRLNKSLTSSSKKYQKRHRLFLKTLRWMLKQHLTDSNGEINELGLLLLELCKTKFYRVHMFSFGHLLLKDLFQDSSKLENSQDIDLDRHFDRYSLLDESTLILSATPNFTIEKEIRRYSEGLRQKFFDPHKYNHPFLLYTLALFRNGGVCRLKMVRMGCPTREAWGKPPVVIEEFLGFLKQLEIEGKSHLYVNKQRTWGSEGMRSQAVKGLESCYKNYFCICLPSDGAFYYQEAPYGKLEEAKEFKNTFYQLLVGKAGVGYYHLPKKWLAMESFLEALERILEDVHDCYYDHKETLSVTERRFFIDHVYTQIILYCLTTFQIDSANITCRDGIDRAGCEQSKLIYYMQISLGIEEQLDSKVERQFVLHIPPYLAKTRPMIKERREYLHQLLSQSYNKSVKEKIYKQGSCKPLLYTKPHFVKRS